MVHPGFVREFSAQRNRLRPAAPSPFPGILSKFSREAIRFAREARVRWECGEALEYCKLTTFGLATLS